MSDTQSNSAILKDTLDQVKAFIFNEEGDSFDDYNDDYLRSFKTHDVDYFNNISFAEEKEEEIDEKPEKLNDKKIEKESAKNKENVEIDALLDEPVEMMYTPLLSRAFSNRPMTPLRSKYSLKSPSPDYFKTRKSNRVKNYSDYDLNFLLPFSDKKEQTPVDKQTKKNAKKKISSAKKPEKKLVKEQKKPKTAKNSQKSAKQKTTEKSKKKQKNEKFETPQATSKKPKQKISDISPIMSLNSYKEKYFGGFEDGFEDGFEEQKKEQNSNYFYENFDDVLEPKPAKKSAKETKAKKNNAKSTAEKKKDDGKVAKARNLRSKKTEKRDEKNVKTTNKTAKLAPKKNKKSVKSKIVVQSEPNTNGRRTLRKRKAPGKWWVCNPSETKDVSDVATVKTTEKSTKRTKKAKNANNKPKNRKNVLSKKTKNKNKKTEHNEIENNENTLEISDFEASVVDDYNDNVEIDFSDDLIDQSPIPKRNKAETVQKIVQKDSKKTKTADNNDTNKINQSKKEHIKKTEKRKALAAKSKTKKPAKKPTGKPARNPTRKVLKTARNPTRKPLKRRKRKPITFEYAARQKKTANKKVLKSTTVKKKIVQAKKGIKGNKDNKVKKGTKNKKDGKNAEKSSLRKEENVKSKKTEKASDPINKEGNNYFENKRGRRSLRERLAEKKSESPLSNSLNDTIDLGTSNSYGMAGNAEPMDEVNDSVSYLLSSGDEKETESRSIIAKDLSKLELKKFGSRDEAVFAAAAIRSVGMSVGSLQIPPKHKKKLMRTEFQEFFFLNAAEKLSVKVTIENSSKLLSGGSVFMVPEKSAYSIENLSRSKKTDLVFMVKKEDF